MTPDSSSGDRRLGRERSFGDVVRHPRRSLVGRISGSFLTLSVVTLGIVATVGYLSSRSGLRESLDDQLRVTSALKEGELNRWVDGQRELLRLVSHQPDVRESAARQTDSESLARLQEIADLTLGSRLDLVEVFFMATAGGRVVVSTAPERVNTFHATDLFFLEGRSRVVVQPLYPSPSTGQPQMTIAAPVLGPDGQTVAVLGAHLNLDRMDAIVYDQLGVHRTAQAYLVTQTNEFVSGHRFGLPEFRRGVHSEGIRAAVSGGTGVGAYRNFEGIPVIGAYRWLPDRELALLVEISQDEAFAPARQLLLQVVLFGLAATLVLLLGVSSIARSVAGPVVAVGKAAATVASGDFSAVAPVRGDDEVGDLARAFNSMTGRLRAVYSDLEHQVAVTRETLTALEENRSLLRSILDNSTALIAVTDPTGTVQVMNDAFLGLLGIGAEEAVGVRLGTLLPSEIKEGWVQAKRDAFQAEAVIEREMSWRVGNIDRTFLCFWFPLTDGGERPFGVGMIATDLTERKRAEEERRRFEGKLRHAQKLESLGVLAGGIAHDFNNILGAILGHADLASDSLSDAPEEARSHLDQVMAAAQGAANLTNQMLAYAGRASFKVETLDLNRAIEEMSTFMAVSLPKKVRLETHFSSEPLPVRADPAQLSQVVMNLITNAAQAIGDAPGTVELATVASKTGQGEAKAILRVKDTGKGMDVETREKIFDPFFTTKDQGRGLGLAAVLGIVNGLDGSIEVESEPGAGTTFTVVLPVEKGEEEPGSAGQSRASVAEGTGTTILVVDDEDLVRSFAVKALERESFSVLQAADGLEALEIFNENRPDVDLVVLDLSMPGMGGIEVFGRLRELDPKLPVIFVSGYDPEDAARSIEDREHVRFLQKPFRPASIVEKVSGLLHV